MKTKTQSSFNVRTYVFLILLFLSALTYKVIEPNQLTNYLLFATAIVCLVIYTIVNTTQPILTKEDNLNSYPFKDKVSADKFDKEITGNTDDKSIANHLVAIEIRIKELRVIMEEFEKETGYVPRHINDEYKVLYKQYCNY